MTNKDKKSHGDSCCSHGEKGESSTCSPLPLNTFNEELKKESPEFYKKMHDAKSDQNLFKSEDHFLEELKKNAPKTYEKLKSCNFKFKLDDSTKQNWLKVMDQAGNVMHKLDELESASGKINK